jgi:quercetin dioxygenase-like cupin family protein
MKTLHVTNSIHRSLLRRTLLLIAPALVIIAALTAVPAHATPQSGVTSVAIANGTFDDIDVYAKTDIDPGPTTDYWKAAISTKGASHLYLVQNTVIPGGTFGWHSHPGPSLVIVVSGTATEYEGDDPTCTPHVHPAGSTFVDAGEATGHLVRNEGSVNLVVVVARLIPEAVAPTQRIDLPNPGYCPNIN